MGTWILITLIVSLCIAGYIGFVKVKHKLNSMSQSLFGTDSFIEGWNRQADILAATPKSVSGMTRVFAPQIETDFPGFNINQFKSQLPTT